MGNVSQETRQRIFEAVDEVAARVAAGADPNVAIAKVASERPLPEGALPILVATYNRGMFAERFSSGDSLSEKAASFPVADLREVNKLLYRMPELPAEKKAKQVVADDYDAPPQFPFVPEQKQASASILDNPPDVLPAGVSRRRPPAQFESQKEVMRRIGKKQAALRRVTRLHQQAQRHLEKAAELSCRLTSYMKDPRTPPVDELRKQAAAAFGERVGHIVDHLAGLIPELRRLRKQASDRLVEIPGEVFATLSELADHLDQYQVLSQEHRKLAAKFDQQYGRQLPERPLKRIKPWTIDLEKIGKKKEAFTSGVRGVVTATLANRAVTNVLDSEAEDVDRTVNTLMQLRQERLHDQLSAVRMAALVSELMTSDPVIANADPETVARTVRDIYETNPNIVANKLALQALVREIVTVEHASPAVLRDTMQVADAVAKRDEQDFATAIQQLESRKKRLEQLSQQKKEQYQQLLESRKERQEEQNKKQQQSQDNDKDQDAGSEQSFWSRIFSWT